MNGGDFQLTNELNKSNRALFSNNNQLNITRKRKKTLGDSHPSEE